MHKVLLVFGTRPEAIKMAPLVCALRDSRALAPCVCVTGQHREMLDGVLRLFDIAPEHDLAAMRPGQDLSGLLARCLEGLARVIELERPAALLVHGDTSTSLAGALAAFHARVPLGHVEAGLRSGDMASPFPEEMNRVLVDRLARWHWAPTERARAALLAEGADPARVAVTGNTVIDALYWVRERVQGAPPARFRFELSREATGVLERAQGPLILITAHRRESFGAPLAGLCDTLRALALEHPDWTFVWPVHLNPQVQQPARERLSGLANVALCAPLAYEPFTWLLDRCTLVLTDSGGVQEEAPALGKPVLVLREKTERPEAIAAGGVRLVGTRPAALRAALEQLLGDPSAFAAMAHCRSPYGDGRAAARIAAHLETELGSPRADAVLAA